MKHSHITKAYARWAPIYDAVFAAVMKPGRQAAAKACEGRRLLLDVGVGTGLELPMFSAATQIVGIDLSEPMLRRAQARIHESNLHNVAGLVMGDAMQLPFGDNVFDVAVAPYVLTVVPDPGKTLDEIARVVRPGGEIIIVNHIGAEQGLMAHAEAALAKISHFLGWRPQFPWAILGEWLSKRPDLTLVERTSLAPFGLFTLARILRA